MLTLFTKSVRTFWDMRYILLVLVTIQSTGWLQETTATGLVMLGVLSASESGWTVYRSRLSLTFGKSGGTVLQEELICPHKSVAARFLAFPNLKTQETKVSNPMVSRPLGPVHGLTGWRVGGGGTGGLHLQNGLLYASIDNEKMGVASRPENWSQHGSAFKIHFFKGHQEVTSLAAKGLLALEKPMEKYSSEFQVISNKPSGPLC